ncbi:MAG TPA: hypothetical protein VMG12_12735 [Polyangiaceae bacterium]|nr:hypothetical protein [Polyangiaceae bacterium]
MAVVYDVVLVAHSFVRWWVLVACGLAAFCGLGGRARGSWSARDRGVARLFVGSVDLQVLLGLSLYFGVSPLARAARAVWASEGFRALWAAPELRFIGLIHPLLALSAALVAHASWVGVRRSERPSERHARLGWGAALAAAILLAAVPWPFLGHERPWFRF